MHVIEVAQVEFVVEALDDALGHRHVFVPRVEDAPASRDRRFPIGIVALPPVARPQRLGRHVRPGAGA
jgi:hypothetical protein